MTLKNAIKNKNISEIRQMTKTIPIADIADMLEELSYQECLIYFRLLKKDVQSEIFAQLEFNVQERLIKSFTDQQMKEIIGDLYASEIADLIEDVPENLVSRILKATDKETRSDVNKILRYNDDQIGSVMNVDIITLKQTLTIKEAIQIIKKQKDEIRLTRHFFVVNFKKKLLGYISIEDLLFEEDNKLISKFIKPTASVITTTNKEEAAIEFANYDMSVLPVINSKKEVIGIITSDEVIDIVTEEATEDIQKMAGIEKNNDIPYSKTTTWQLLKSRTFWLMFLMVSATLSQTVLDFFQGFSNGLSLEMGAITTSALVAILPVISGAAGNAGSQSSTTIIRAIATGDISSKDYLKVFLKELKVSILIGFLLGLANFIRLIIYYFLREDLQIDYVILSLGASISLFVVIILAKIVGGTLPLLAKYFKLDPAVIAAPLLTTLIDALSTMIFFSISIGIIISII